MATLVRVTGIPIEAWAMAPMHRSMRAPRKARKVGGRSVCKRAGGTGQVVP